MEEKESKKEEPKLRVT